MTLGTSYQIRKMTNPKIIQPGNAEKSSILMALTLYQCILSQGQNNPQKESQSMKISFCFSGMSASMFRLCLIAWVIYKKHAKWFPLQQLYSFTFLLAMYELSSFPTSLPAFGGGTIFWFNHPDKCVVVGICGFD